MWLLLLLCSIDIAHSHLLLLSILSLLVDLRADLSILVLLLLLLHVDLEVLSSLGGGIVLVTRHES